MNEIVPFNAEYAEMLKAEIDRLRAELVVARAAVQGWTDCANGLRAELTEARAMYVGAQADLNEAVGRVVDVRVELAEADSAYGKEIARLRAELAQMTRKADHYQRQYYADPGATEAEAAVARVRELCAKFHGGPYLDEDFDAQVLRALDGAE